MKINEVKRITIEFEEEELNHIEEILDSLSELKEEMKLNKCTNLSGDDYEVPIDISKEQLEKTINVLKNLHYITEMY